VGGEKWFDPDGMRQIANRLDQAADEADSAGVSMPESLDAGPFTPLIVSMVNAVAAEDANLIMRLGMAAEKIRTAASKAEQAEEESAKTIEDVWRDMAGD
jgi:uncharacterized protein YukE